MNIDEEIARRDRTIARACETIDELTKSLNAALARSAVEREVVEAVNTMLGILAKKTWQTVEERAALWLEFVGTWVPNLEAAVSRLAAKENTR